MEKIETQLAPTGWIRPSNHGRRVIVVSGAKGGVGKTVFSVNLAVYLATIGRRVVLIDADSGGANAHTMLGCERPRPTEKDRLGAEVETSVPGLRLLRVGLDRPGSGGMRHARRSRLLEGLRELDADHVVVDLGAGTVSTLVDLYLAADLSVYLTLPEPTAIENTYRFLRGAFARSLKSKTASPEVQRRVLSTARALGGAPAPLDLLNELQRDDDEGADAAFVLDRMRDFTPRIVMNQARVRADLELGDSMRTAVHRRYGIEIDYLGHIDFDDTVWSCVRARRPLLVETPGTKASKSIEKIVRRLLASDAGRVRRTLPRDVPFGSHHDYLEVDRGATDEEIRRAYKRAKDIYESDSMACYALFEPSELASVRARLEESYDVLLDPFRRKPYELSVFPDHAPEPTLVDLPSPDRVLPPLPEITPDTEFNGPLLRAVREARGLELSEISKKTKIGTVHLRAIEEDDFALLPDAPVYVRGFVAEFAKTLSLDPEQVCRSYVRRYKRYTEDKQAGGRLA